MRPERRGVDGVAKRARKAAMVRWLVLTLLLALLAVIATESATAAVAGAPARDATAASGDCGPCPSTVYAKGSGGGRIDLVTRWSDGRRDTDSCQLAAHDSCSFFVEDGAGTVVRPEEAYLQPVANAGAPFRQWQACPDQRDERCYLPLGSVVAVCAVFGTGTVTEDCPPAAILVMKKGTGSGRVLASADGISGSCEVDCAYKVMRLWREGTTVELMAEPSTGSQFVRWDGCPSGEANPCRLQASRVLQYACAVFVPGGTAPPADRSCPASSTRPPPPPADRPPRLGSRCTHPGSPGPDVIVGTAGNDVICGRGGNDVIRGRGGHDLILGGAGNDRVYGGAGNELILGGPGDDRLYGEGGKDELRGERGNDTLTGGAGADVLVAGIGADVLYARDRVRDSVNGGTGRDRARVDAIDRLRSIERRF